MLPRRSIKPLAINTLICLSMVLNGTPSCSEISAAVQPKCDLTNSNVLLWLLFNSPSAFFLIFDNHHNSSLLGNKSEFGQACFVPYLSAKIIKFSRLTPFCPQKQNSSRLDWSNRLLSYRRLPRCDSPTNWNQSMTIFCVRTFSPWMRRKT